MKQPPAAMAVHLGGIPTDIAQRLKLDPDTIVGAVGNYECFKKPTDSNAILSALATTLAVATESSSLMLPAGRQCTTRAEAIVLVSDATQLIAADFGIHPSVTEVAALYVLVTMHAQLHHDNDDEPPLSFARFYAVRMVDQFTEQTDACRTAADLEDLKSRVMPFIALCTRHGAAPYFFWPSTMRQLDMFRQQGTDRDGQPLDGRVRNEVVIVARERHEADHVVVRDDDEFDAMIDEAKKRIANFLKLRREFEDSFNGFLHSRGIKPESKISYHIQRGAELNFAAMDGSCRVMIGPGSMPGSVSITVIPESGFPPELAAIAELISGLRPRNR